MIVVSIQMQRAGTRELGDIISEPLPTNGLIRGASLPVLFLLS
jgi:hypothetical protein